MKRMIAILLAVLTMTAVLAACGSDGVTDSGNVSTTPNGTVNGTNGANGANGNGVNGNQNGVTGNQNGANGSSGAVTTPNENNSGMYDSNRNGMEDNFENGAEDIIEGTGNAIDEAVTGRSARTGTGMTGGR